MRHLIRIATAGLVLAALAAPALAEGQLRGTTKDADGKPLQGVEIKLVPSKEEFTTLITTSNKKGKFVIGMIRPDNYRLVAFAPGMRITRVDANVAVPDDDSLWAFHDEVPQGAELPFFLITGLSKVDYDIVFEPHDGEPGAYGTGLPVSPTKVILGLMNEGKTDEAVEVIRRNLKDNPESEVFNYLLAFVLRMEGRPDEALVAVDRSLETDPLFEGANLLKGKILEDQGDVERALEFFQTEADSANSVEVQRDALLALAVAYENLDRQSDAIEALERLIEVAPDHVGAYKELADLYTRRGDSEKAQEMMDEVFALGAADPRLLYNLGAERFNASEFEEAADYFVQAIEADPEFRDAYLRLAYTRLNLGDTDGAMESLEQYIELSTEETQEVQTARAILQQLQSKKQQ
jgi:tetratricopeptide (TPR) repeat protein